MIMLFSEISCESKKSSKCELREIKTLFTIPAIYQNVITGYAHYILIKDFSRECLDSSTIVNIALKYMDTVKIGRPADVLMFFSSNKDFIPNEKSQVMEEINKSCLVTIGFDEKTNKPNDFFSIIAREIGCTGELIGSHWENRFALIWNDQPFNIIQFY